MIPVWISQVEHIRPLLIVSDKINTGLAVLSTALTLSPHGQKMAAAAPYLKTIDI